MQTTTTTNFIDCTEQTLAEQARRAAAMKAKPFVLMLRDPYTNRWSLEDRYASEAKLEDAVRQFAHWWKEDNDGFTPEAGRDFIACKSYDYPDLWQD